MTDLNLTAVPAVIRTAHKTALVAERRATAKLNAAYDQYYAAGYRAEHFTKDLVSLATGKNGENESVPNELYQDVYDIGIRSLPKSMQRLAYMTQKDAKDLDEPSKKDRTDAKKVGTDAVSNTVAALKRRKKEEQKDKDAVELVGKIKARLDKDELAEAEKLDAALVVQSKPPKHVPKLIGDMKAQMEQEEADKNWDKSTAVKCALLFKSLKKKERFPTLRKSLEKAIKELDGKK